MESDAIYFARRAKEEREAAMKATPVARQIHIEMADRYDEFASAIALREQDPEIRVAAN